MADTSQQQPEAPEPPQTNGVVDGLTEEEKSKIRPADIDADMREMERRKRVEMMMNSRLFREELERIIETQMKDGAGPSGLLQQISEMMGPQGARFNTSVFRNSNCVVPINDIRGVESMGYAKGEKLLRCKLAAVFRLLDLYGWTQGVGGMITARLNQDQEHFLVNPYGLLYHEVTASSLVKVDMQGGVVEQGTTNFGVHIASYQLHSTIHAARPDIKCIVHIATPAVTAMSSTKCGILPLGQESIVIGEVSAHQYVSGANLDPEEREKLARNFGPINKVMLLTNRGALCCGETVEEAFYNVYNTVLACETQLKLMPVGVDNLNLISDEVRKAIYEASRKAPVPQQSSVAEPSALAEKLEKRWRIGGTEFEALMRMLDNAGFRTGYIYRHPLVKSEPPRPRNDVEVPPAVSSLGYLLEEEELYKQGLWKGGRKGTDRTRWLNSPNVYQKVEILETGTPDPKKITKWVSDGSPTHSSTPVKIEGALQFVPKNTNPKEFKQLQQQIKDYRRADKISAGPQSHILEGVTWEEAKKMQDATISGTGEQVVLVGAASKGIIQRGFQHNAMVYKTPYAKNPFDAVTDQELDQYKKEVERKTKGDIYDESQSESEALSSFNISRATHESSTAKSPIQSPVSVTSETEEESRDEPKVLRIETKQVPAPSQPEVVLSDERSVESSVTENLVARREDIKTEQVKAQPGTNIKTVNADFLNEQRRSEMMTRRNANGRGVSGVSTLSSRSNSSTDDWWSWNERYNPCYLEQTRTEELARPMKVYIINDNIKTKKQRLKREFFENYDNRSKNVETEDSNKSKAKSSKYDVIRSKFDKPEKKNTKSSSRRQLVENTKAEVDEVKYLRSAGMSFPVRVNLPMECSIDEICRYNVNDDNKKKSYSPTTEMNIKNNNSNEEQFSRITSSTENSLDSTLKLSENDLDNKENEYQLKEDNESMFDVNDNFNQIKTVIYVNEEDKIFCDQDCGPQKKKFKKNKECKENCDDINSDKPNEISILSKDVNCHIFKLEKNNRNKKCSNINKESNYVNEVEFYVCNGFHITNNDVTELNSAEDSMKLSAQEEAEKITSVQEPCDQNAVISINSSSVDTQHKECNEEKENSTGKISSSVIELDKYINARNEFNQRVDNSGSIIKNTILRKNVSCPNLNKLDNIYNSTNGSNEATHYLNEIELYVCDQSNLRQTNSFSMENVKNELYNTEEANCQENLDYKEFPIREKKEELISDHPTALSNNDKCYILKSEASDYSDKSNSNSKEEITQYVNEVKLYVCSGFEPTNSEETELSNVEIPTKLTVQKGTKKVIATVEKPCNQNALEQTNSFSVETNTNEMHNETENINCQRIVQCNVQEKPILELETRNCNDTNNSNENATHYVNEVELCVYDQFESSNNPLAEKSSTEDPLKLSVLEEISKMESNAKELFALSAEIQSFCSNAAKLKNELCTPENMHSEQSSKEEISSDVKEKNPLDEELDKNFESESKFNQSLDNSGSTVKNNNDEKDVSISSQNTDHYENTTTINKNNFIDDSIEKFTKYQEKPVLELETVNCNDKSYNNENATHYVNEVELYVYDQHSNNTVVESISTEEPLKLSVQEETNKIEIKVKELVDHNASLQTFCSNNFVNTANLKSELHISENSNYQENIQSEECSKEKLILDHSTPVNGSTDEKNPLDAELDKYLGNEFNQSLDNSGSTIKDSNDVKDVSISSHNTENNETSTTWLTTNANNSNFMDDSIEKFSKYTRKPGCLDLTFSEIDPNNEDFSPLSTTTQGSFFMDDDLVIKRISRRDSIVEVVSNIASDIQPSSKLTVDSLADTENSVKYNLDSQNMSLIYSLTPPNDVENSSKNTTITEDIIEDNEDDENDNEDIMWLNFSNSIDNRDMNKTADISEMSFTSNVSNPGSDLLELPRHTYLELQKSSDDLFHKNMSSSVNQILTELNDAEVYVQAENFVDQLIFDVACLSLPHDINSFTKPQIRKFIRDKIEAMNYARKLASDLVTNLPTRDGDKSANSKVSSNEVSNNVDSFLFDENFYVIREIVHHVVDKDSLGKFDVKCKKNVTNKEDKESMNIELKGLKDEYDAEDEKSMRCSTPKLSPQKSEENSFTENQVFPELDHDEEYVEVIEESAPASSKSQQSSDAAVSTNSSPSVESQNFAEQEITSESTDNDTKSDDSKEKQTDTETVKNSTLSPNPQESSESSSVPIHVENVATPIFESISNKLSFGIIEFTSNDSSINVTLNADAQDSETDSNESIENFMQNFMNHEEEIEEMWQANEDKLEENYAAQRFEVDIDKEALEICQEKIQELLDRVEADTRYIEEQSTSFMCNDDNDDDTDNCMGTHVQFEKVDNCCNCCSSQNETMILENTKSNLLAPILEESECDISTTSEAHEEIQPDLVDQSKLADSFETLPPIFEEPDFVSLCDDNLDESSELRTTEFFSCQNSSSMKSCDEQMEMTCSTFTVSTEVSIDRDTAPNDDSSVSTSKADSAESDEPMERATNNLTEEPTNSSCHSSSGPQNNDNGVDTLENMTCSYETSEFLQLERACSTDGDKPNYVHCDYIHMLDYSSSSDCKDPTLCTLIAAATQMSESLSAMSYEA